MVVSSLQDSAEVTQLTIYRDDANNVVLDPPNRGITINGETRHLTGTELRYLQCLVARNGAIVPHATFLRMCLGYVDPESEDPHVNNVWIHRVRTKLGDLGTKVIVTAQGQGYRLHGRIR